MLRLSVEHHIRGKPKSREIHARGVYNAYRHDTSK